MVKNNIVIASVLKPIDDTRMYEKFGITLSSLSKFHIHIVGFHSETTPSHPNISFHPLFNFPRLSIKRFLAPLKFYKFIHKVKPDVLIVNSPDLLIVSFISKILFGFKLLYDVQENYYYNLLYTDVFSSPFKQILAFAIRGVECICSLGVYHFFLAERTYRYELPFIGKRYSIIENKYNPIHGTDASYKRGIHHLLYSGTIAESYGVFSAIELVKTLWEFDPRFHLTIIGYCAKADDYTKLVDIIKDIPYINLVGGNSLVPHKQIIGAIAEADVGLIVYQDNVSTRNRIPTKFYEYIYHGLPMLIPDNTLWKEFCSYYNAAVVVDYEFFSSSYVVDRLLHFPFYIFSSPSLSVSWDDESVKLLAVFDNFV